MPRRWNKQITTLADLLRTITSLILERQLLHCSESKLQKSIWHARLMRRNHRLYKIGIVLLAKWLSYLPSNYYKGPNTVRTTTNKERITKLIQDTDRWIRTVSMASHMHTEALVHSISQYKLQESNDQWVQAAFYWTKKNR